MIAAQENCLDQKTLRELLEGRLPEDRFAMAWEHVDACPLCTTAMEGHNADAGKNSFSWLRRAAVLDWSAAEAAARFDHESQCQALVGDLLVNRGSTEMLTNQRDSLQVDRLPRQSLGPYRLIRAIGSGGMANVYLAEHQRLKRQVAIKLLPREKLLRSGWLDRFNREMTSIAALEHANVVRALDAGDEDDWHYLVMEHLEGLDLSQICRRVSDVSVGAACELIRQAALGLAAIHAVGMVHRDVKPSNIFLTRGGTVKLLDLGLVLSGESPLSADERLTTVGHLMGTIPYMAREQLNDARAVDHRTDLYSLGASLVRILTGKPPYGSAENLARTISQISTLDCPSIADNRADLPDELVAVVTQLLSHDPAQRPQSAQQVAEALEPFADPAQARELLRVAENTPPLDTSMISTHRSIETSSRNQPPRRWSAWIAAGLLFPLLFGAGILVTVATDQGTLTIQSDLPGVEVVVKQGENAVKSLQVEQQSQSIRLRSGRYTIELTGIASDGLEISDNAITIVRGDKQLVHISRSESVSAPLDQADGENSILQKALSFVPQQPNVEYELSHGDWRSYSLVEFKTLEGSGFEIKNRLGQRARWFGDTNDDSKLDTWIYYKDGVEAYREHDSNGDRKADTFTWADGRKVSMELPGKTLPNEKLFQDKPLGHWMQALVRDQDNQTLGQAMQAVVLLAETDAEKLEAAKQFLIPARRLGGIYSTGGGPRPENPSPSDLSQWFMTDLLRWYPNLFPQAGLSAIEDELRNPNGTEAGWLACMWLLTEFSDGYDAIGTPVLARSYYDTLIESDEGRQHLEGLQALIGQRSEGLLTTAGLLPEPTQRRYSLRTGADMGIQHRLMILKLLGGVPQADPQIDDWAMRQLEVANAAIAALPEPSGQQLAFLLRADTALDIHAAVGAPAEYLAPLVFGLLSPNDDDQAAKTLLLLDAVVTQHPLRGALAVEKFLQFQKVVLQNGLAYRGRDLNAVNVESLPFWSTEPIRRAKNLLATHHPDPVVALQLLGSFIELQDSKEVDASFNIKIIDELLIRLILETDMDTDSRSDAKFAYAAYAYNELQRWIDDERRGSADHQRARAVLLMNGALEGHHSSTNGVISFKDPKNLSSVAVLADLDARDWNDATFYASLSRLTRQYPSQWLPAIADQMRESEVLVQELSQHLLPDLLIELAWSSHASDSELKKYVDQPSSRSVFQSIFDSLQRSLTSQSAAADGDPTPMLRCSLQSYVAIHRLLGESLLENQRVIALLRSYVTWAVERHNERELPMDLLIALSAATSPAEIPLPAVWSAASNIGQVYRIDVEHKREFIRDVSAVDRAAFNSYFLSQLQAIVSRADDGWIDSFLARNAVSSGSLWQTIFDALRSESTTRSSTEEVLRKMLQHFDATKANEGSHSMRRQKDLQSLLAPQ